MTEFPDHSFAAGAFDERLEHYLDGVMSDEDCAAFEGVLATNPQLAAEVAIQARIDASLLRTFPTAVVPASHIAALEKHLGTALNNRESARVKLRWPWILGIASAAAAACLGVALWNFDAQSGRTPHFAPLPLAQIYKHSVAEGFEPYYECRDDERFADTFEQRQGMPLRLKKLPVGSAMKGLSYPGGLSRNTTAMLCDNSGVPVMVFVDREEEDAPIAAINNDPELNIFRDSRGGLVFYEVTPLDLPTMMGYLDVIE